MTCIVAIQSHATGRIVIGADGLSGIDDLVLSRSCRKIICREHFVVAVAGHLVAHNIIEQERDFDAVVGVVEFIQLFRRKAEDRGLKPLDPSPLNQVVPRYQCEMIAAFRGAVKPELYYIGDGLETMLVHSGQPVAVGSGHLPALGAMHALRKMRGLKDAVRIAIEASSEIVSSVGSKVFLAEIEPPWEVTLHE